MPNCWAAFPPKSDHVRLAQQGTPIICRKFTHIPVSRSPYHAQYHLTRNAQAEQAQMLATLRRARYGYQLALHVLLLCAAQRTPNEIAACLFCARSSVTASCRPTRKACWVYGQRGGHAGTARADDGVDPSPEAVAAGAPQGGAARLLLVPHTLELYHAGRDLTDETGGTVSAEMVRRWLHEVGWVWKRAKLVATDNDPHRGGASPASAGCSSISKPGRRWSLPTSSIFTCCPRSAMPGCPKARRSPSGRRAKMRSIPWPAPAIWPLEGWCTAWGRGKRTPCSVTCPGPSLPPLRLHAR